MIWPAGIKEDHMKRDVVLTIRIPDDLKKAAREEAKKQKRSLSNFVEWVLTQYIEKQGKS